MGAKHTNAFAGAVTAVERDKDGNPIIHVDGDKFSKNMAVADYDEKELEKAQQVVSDLLETHWIGIQGAIIKAGDGLGAVSLSIKLDHTGPERELKAKIAYSVKTSDEIEVTVRDPRQPELKGL